MTELLMPQSRHFTSQSLKLHYLDWGNPEAPILILQHGGFDHAHSMDWIARELARDWHVIAPDLRGHGDSQWSPDSDYTMAAYLLDFANLIATLPDAPVTICAHSLGAMVTTRYAGLYPDQVRRFVNIEGLALSGRRDKTLPPMTYADRVRRWIELHQEALTRLPRRYPSEEAAFSRMRDNNPYLTDERVRYLTHHALHANGDGSFSWKFDPRLNIWTVIDFPPDEVIRIWEAVTCPILFFHGSDTFMPNPGEDGRIGHFRNARLVEYDQASHWLHHDRFDLFMADLNAFLAEG